MVDYVQEGEAAGYDPKDPGNAIGEDLKRGLREQRVSSKEMKALKDQITQLEAIKTKGIEVVYDENGRRKEWFTKAEVVDLAMAGIVVATEKYLAASIRKSRSADSRYEPNVRDKYDFKRAVGMSLAAVPHWDDDAIGRLQQVKDGIDNLFGPAGVGRSLFTDGNSGNTWDREWVGIIGEEYGKRMVMSSGKGEYFAYTDYVSDPEWDRNGVDGMGTLEPRVLVNNKVGTIKFDGVFQVKVRKPVFNEDSGEGVDLDVISRAVNGGLASRVLGNKKDDYVDDMADVWRANRLPLANKSRGAVAVLIKVNSGRGWQGILKQTNDRDHIEVFSSKLYNVLLNAKVSGNIIKGSESKRA